MESATRAELEHRRRRLLTSVFVVLVAFAGGSVAFSLLGPDILVPLHATPTAVRLGVLLLTFGFVALVWEKEREFRTSSERLTRQQLLITSFESRLRAVEGLLDASGRVHAPIAVDDLLKVVLEAAIELAGAEGGTVETVEEAGDELMEARQMTIGRSPSEGATPSISFPLVAEGETVGKLTLSVPGGVGGLDRDVMDAVEAFTKQAGAALEKARLLARERATIAFLEASNVVRSSFITAVSHQLRTPLTSIVGFSRTLDDRWEQLSEPQRREFVRGIESRGEELRGLVEGVLEEARQELQGIVVSPVVHDVRESVLGALHDCMDPSRVEVHLPREAALAAVDPFVVDQVVWNLVDNSLRHTDSPVEVSLELLDRWISIEIADRGEGIGKPELAKLRSPIDADGDPGGRNGMGLKLVRTLVESHGGRARVKSDTSGSRMAVLIPAWASEAVSSRALDSALGHTI